ncbi:MAG: hypothetical protein PUP93_08400, partial [Rhizonema sp. NSF051]|nr:hypothetical protein [Rhizonema sp. NSF051]
MGITNSSQKFLSQQKAQYFLGKAIMGHTNKLLIAASKIIIFITIATTLVSCSSIAKGIRRGLAEEVSEKVTKLVIEKAFNKLTQNTPNLDKKQISTQAFLMQTANEINKSLPIVVDSDTQLYNVTVKENALTFNYILVNYASWEIDPNKLLAGVKNVRISACSSSDTQIFWRNNISF